jgi:hypothetical protein
MVNQSLSALSLVGFYENFLNQPITFFRFNLAKFQGFFVIL